MSDDEGVLMCVFIGLGFFGTLGFGGSYSLAIFIAILAMCLGANVVSTNRRGKGK